MNSKYEMKSKQCPYRVTSLRITSVYSCDKKIYMWNICGHLIPQIDHSQWVKNYLLKPYLLVRSNRDNYRNGFTCYILCHFVSEETSFPTSCWLSYKPTPAGKGSTLKGKNLLLLMIKFFHCDEDP